jgi:hypothetical protein
VLRLAVVAVLAVLIHGYHLGADDAAIYVPGIKQAADPVLYPFGAEFFQSHARLTILPSLVGGSARLLGLPVDSTIFAWHIGGLFLLMLASWKLLCVWFTTPPARWGGIAMLAGVLSVPVAGTALFIADPYVTSRTLSTPATVFAIACFTSGQQKQAAFWWLLTALIHPQMGVYAGLFLLSLAIVTRRATFQADRTPAPIPESVFGGLPFPLPLLPARGAAREALLSRSYFFVSQWTWYEWIGVFAPLALLGWLSTRDVAGATTESRSIARTATLFGIVFTLSGLALTLSARLENYTRLQPMRALHLIYIVFFLLFGGLAGEYVLHRSVWRWLGLFVPLVSGMFLLQIGTYPASAHVEWPGASSANPWYDAFLWIRHNTPRSAVFALDPGYMLRTGEDMAGFRAIAERSTLADAVKDSGAVSLFPALADEWQNELRSTLGWRHFELADFRRLTGQYPVTWFVVELPAPAGLLCLYRNQGVAVCTLPSIAVR